MRLGNMKPDWSLAEALEQAMAFEMDAFEFYSDLAGKMRPEVRSMAEELAAEELEHYRLLSDLAGDEMIAEQLNERISRLHTADTLDQYIQIGHLPENPIEDDLIEYAESREKLAREHYGLLVEITPEGPLRNLFVFLHAEEQKHADKLAARWSELFSVF